MEDQLLAIAMTTYSHDLRERVIRAYEQIGHKCQDLCDHRLYNHAKLQQARQVLRSLIQERAVNEPSQ